MTDLACFGVVLSNIASGSDQLATVIIMVTIRPILQLMVTMVGAEHTAMESPHRKTQEEIRNKERNKEDITDIFFSVKVH